MPTRALLRRLAAFVLLLWLFGVASGVANACVAASGLRHAAHAVAVEAALDHASHGVHVAPAQGGHDHGVHDDQPPCERLCEEPRARTQGDKQQSIPLASFWLAGAPLPLFPQWPASETMSPAPRAELALRTAIPIPIAYLRLTL